MQSQDCVQTSACYWWWLFLGKPASDWIIGEKGHFQVCTAGKNYIVPARNPYKYANTKSSNDRRLLRLTSARCCGSLVLCHQLQAVKRHWHTCREKECTQCLSLLVDICFTLSCLFVCNNMIHHLPREISLWNGRVETCLGLVISFCQDIKFTCD